MKNAENITIGVLVVSAAIITGLLIAVHVSNTPQAQAQTTIKQGQYIVSVGTYTSSYDFVYIVDIRTGRMNAYAAERQRKRVALVTEIEMAPVFQKLRTIQP